MDAARELNQFDGLAAELLPLAEQKVENVESLLIVVGFARGDGSTMKPRIKQLVAAKKVSLG